MPMTDAQAAKAAELQAAITDAGAYSSVTPSVTDVGPAFVDATFDADGRQSTTVILPDGSIL